jgi:hypothetical protein
MLGQFSNFHGNLNKPAMAGGDECPAACVDKRDDSLLRLAVTGKV